MTLGIPHFRAGYTNHLARPTLVDLRVLRGTRQSSNCTRRAITLIRQNLGVYVTCSNYMGARLDRLPYSATWMLRTACNPVALSGGDVVLYQTPSVHTAMPQIVRKGTCIMPYRAMSLVMHGYAPICDQLRLQTLRGKLVLLHAVRCVP